MFDVSWTLSHNLFSHRIGSSRRCNRYLVSSHPLVSSRTRFLTHATCRRTRQSSSEITISTTDTLCFVWKRRNNDSKTCCSRKYQRLKSLALSPSKTKSVDVTKESTAYEQTKLITRANSFKRRLLPTLFLPFLFLRFRFPTLLRSFSSTNSTFASSRSRTTNFNGD